MLGENFKKTIIYRYLRELIEDMQDSDKYDIDKSIEQILDDDNLWDEFYNNINADLVEKGE